MENPKLIQAGTQISEILLDEFRSLPVGSGQRRLGRFHLPAVKREGTHLSSEKPELWDVGLGPVEPVNEKDFAVQQTMTFTRGEQILRFLLDPNRRVIVPKTPLKEEDLQELKKGLDYAEMLKSDSPEKLDELDPNSYPPTANDIKTQGRALFEYVSTAKDRKIRKRKDEKGNKVEIPTLSKTGRDEKVIEAYYWEVNAAGTTYHLLGISKGRNQEAIYNTTTGERCFEKVDPSTATRTITALPTLLTSAYYQPEFSREEFTQISEDLLRG